MENNCYEEILDFLLKAPVAKFFDNIQDYILDESDIAIINENRKALITTTIKESPIEVLKNYAFVFNDLDTFVSIVGNSLKGHNWNISNAIQFFYNNPSQKEFVVTFAEDDIICGLSLPDSNKIIYIGN